mgnify:FL=1|jgi:hypothetical protein
MSRRIIRYAGTALVVGFLLWRIGGTPGPDDEGSTAAGPVAQELDAAAQRLQAGRSGSRGPGIHTVEPGRGTSPSDGAAEVMVVRGR